MRTILIIALFSVPAFSVSYKQTLKQDAIQRVDDGAFIPVNPENRDYAAFLLWQKPVKEGGESGVILPADPAVVDPKEIQREQAIIDAKNALLTPQQRLDALIKAIDLK